MGPDDADPNRRRRSPEPEQGPTRDQQARASLRTVLRTGISVRAFSAMTGIARSTLGDFINNRTTPTETTLGRIEEALGFNDEEDFGDA